MNKLKINFIFIILSTVLTANEIICPTVNCSKIISDYGQTVDKKTGKIRLHTGIDFLVPTGSAVYAIKDGKVLKSSEIDGYGKRVLIEHNKSLKSLYAHLSKISVIKGSVVKKGDIIGYSGGSEKSYSPHLHFGIYEGLKMVNPRTYLKIK